jgi:hypothetical protein
MARATPHLCGHPYCSEVLLDGPGYCEEHRRLHRAPRRAGPDHGYTSRAWRRVAKAYRDEHPVCEADACSERAVLVHHRDGSRPNSPGRPNRWQNLASMCVRHHRLLTNGHDVRLAPPSPIS